MHCPQQGKAQNTVELLQHAVQIVYDVVSCGEYMAGIQADPDPFRMLHSVPDGPQLFEPVSDLRALAAHGFQKHRYVFLSRDGLIQPGDDIFNPLFHPDARVASRMKYQILNAKRVHPLHILPDHRAGELIDLFRVACQIHGIGRMGQNGAEAMFPPDALKALLLLLGRRPEIGAPGISAENLHGVRFHLHHVLRRFFKPLRD